MWDDCNSLNGYIHNSTWNLQIRFIKYQKNKFEWSFRDLFVAGCCSDYSNSTVQLHPQYSLPRAQ